ncbi:flagellar brake protein [Paraburkholderia rhizosphaerae]|uniref:flagellar brake protein n=1 Tax=Paraburkholderia rhizosphaerae TaxID=480658 RepID=UPI0035E48A86
MDENVAAPAIAASSAPLNIDAVPIGTPLEWPIVDADGSLLFERGAVVIGADERRFLFEHFKPRRGDRVETPDSPSAAKSHGADDEDTPLSLKDTHLSIGALIGLRPQNASGPMHPSRIIGFAPNQSVFVMPPLVDGRALSLTVGENVEIVAIASQAVFRFVCTVDAVCHSPFDYVVLSKPGVIRRLRERKSIRVRAKLPVRFGLNPDGDGYEGLGVMQTISALGMSFGTPWLIGKVGQRVRVSFRLQSKDTEMLIETTAIVRNAQAALAADGLASHGLEFEHLDTAQQLALKSFVFDRIDDISHWSNGVR